MTRIPKIIELTLKGINACYRHLTPKYPVQYYLFINDIRVRELFEANAYVMFFFLACMCVSNILEF
jgi:hypothetical protein